MGNLQDICLNKRYDIISTSNFCFEGPDLNMKVSEIMTRDLVILKENDSLRKAVNVFSRHSIDSAPVTDEKDHLKGIFSKSELFTAINEGANLEHRVTDFMTVLVPYVYHDQRGEELIDRPEEKFAVVDKARKLVGIITKTDILKAYVAKLKYVTNSLQTLLESTTSAIIAIDKEQQITFINKTAESLLGVQGPHVMGRLISDILPESTLPEVLKTGKKQVGVSIVLNNRRLVTNRSPIIEDNRIVGAVAVFQDITEYEELIDELANERHLREILNTVLEIAYDGIIVTDNKGYITMISNTYKKFLGVEDQDVIGRHCTEVVENSRMHIVAQTGKPEIADMQKIKGKHMIASRLPIIRDGKVVGVVGKVLFRDVSELNALVRKVSKMERELEFYKGELQKANRAKYCFSEIIGISEKIFGVKELARKAAECSSNVLILGESGTGKELFAHAIHIGSERAAYPFIKINCAAIPNDLLEAELFGYADGAFTGAKKGGKAGKFELAQGGTVFLDEIGDMPLQMQVKLLRVLQEKEIEPIGSGQCKEIDVRIIAATNQDLEQLVEAGKFREDLYHRLNVFTFTIPPLRERPEDIRDTTLHLLEKICIQMNKPVVEISPGALYCLESYPWPGNVRELYNVLERAVSLLEAGKIIMPEHLPPRITGRVQGPKTIPLQETVEKAEREAILNALLACGGNRTRTCEVLNISRSTLYERINKYDISI